eukprot:TRINITY_DN13864_c0_g1_i1.p1 TRINITY_DN13864_c0_g1~~TRINITY_DN13864_c0_g1_i1.p1  ORF type:complete len:474 (+),score=68.40 TRINITY_DN13864_c0_g1_i1:101-1522(+)
MYGLSGGKRKATSSLDSDEDDEEYKGGTFMDSFLSDLAGPSYVSSSENFFDSSSQSGLAFNLGMFNLEHLEYNDLSVRSSSSLLSNSENLDSSSHTVSSSTASSYLHHGGRHHHSSMDESPMQIDNMYHTIPGELGNKNNGNYLSIPGYGSPVNSFIKQEDQSGVVSTGLWNARADIVVDEQPPIEVRTRTPNENRSFFIAATVAPRYYYNPSDPNFSPYTVKVELLYYDDYSVVPNQKILGGTKTQPIMENGKVKFDNLCMSEASTKHEEREFCLEFIFVQATSRDHPLQREIRSGVRTKGFYAYSHKKVLTRRQKVELRAMSPTYCNNLNGGEEMHVVGSPFIKGPSLKVVIRTEHGHTVDIKYAEGKLERYSESVLFFKLPPYPNYHSVLLSLRLPPPSSSSSSQSSSTGSYHHHHHDNYNSFDTSYSTGNKSNNNSNNNDLIAFSAYVSVTNDSRHFSNQLKLTYYYKT